MASQKSFGSPTSDPQTPTPIITDNAVAEGIINRIVKQQKSKAMDMRYYWLQDRADQKQLSSDGNQVR